MAFKIGTTTMNIIKVKKNNTTTEMKNVYVKKNNVNTQIYGCRSFALTLTNPEYMTVSYSYTNYKNASTSGSSTSSTTFSEVGFDQNITITASPKTATAQYTYSVSTTGGTYGPSSNSLTIIASRVVNKYAVTIAKGTGVSAVYLSTNAAATSGDSSGTEYDYGTTVYGFATLSSGYSPLSDWVLVSGTTYQIGSVVVDSAEDFGTITPSVSTWSYTVNLGTGQASYKYKIDSGSYTTKSANYTINNISWGSTLTIVGVSASEGYTPNTSTYTRTNANAGGTLTITATRITWTATVTLPTGVTKYKYSTNGGSSWSDETTSTSITGLDYATTLTVKATTVATGYQANGNATASYSSQSVTVPVARISFTTSFALGGANYGSWSSASQTTYYGDLITRSGNTVTCKKWDATSTNRWQVTFTNGSATEYDYSVSYSSITSPATAAQTITATTSRSRKSYTITFTNGLYGSWSSSSLTAYYGDTISRSGNTVSIYKWDATSTLRSSSVYTLEEDTAQYDYSNTYSTITSPITANQTITSTDTRAVKKYAVTITAGTGLSSAYLSSVSSTATSGDPSGTTYNYNTTVYAFVVLAEHYDVPEDANWVLVSGTMHETGSKYRVGSITVSAAHNFGTFYAVIEKYDLSITKGTGISTIYYKVNGASSYASTTSNLSVSVNDLSTYYYYAVADSYHTANADCGSSSSPKSGTVNCADISTSVSSTAKTYNLVGTYTNGSVSWYSNSTMTTSITSAAYGSTVYYKYTADTGYSGSGNGSIVLNTANFTFASTAAGSNATHNFGSATRLTWNLSITKGNYMSAVSYSKNGGSAVAVTGTTNLTNLDYADTIVVSGTKNSDTAQYKYTNVTGTGTFTYSASDQSTTVTCTRSIQVYTITWKNWDGTTLETDSNVQYGATPSYDGSTPTRTQTAQYTYTFSSWSPTVVSVTGNATYTAQYTSTERSYNVTFTNGTYGTWNSTTAISAKYSDTISLSGNVVTVGSTSRTYTLPSDTAQYTYTTTINNASGTVGTGKAITATDVRSTVQYTITWKWLSAYPDTWTTATEQYDYGAIPSRANPSTVTSGNARKAFANWDSLAAVTGNRTIEAVYTQQYNVTSVTGTNCTAYTSSDYSTAFTTGWKNSGTVIYWKAGTATNTKYAFVNSAATWSDSYGKTTATVNVGGSYDKTASYIYYNVTITKNTGTASSNYSSGYLLNGTTVTFTATADATNTKYSYSNTDSTVHTKSYTVSSAGQSISSPTVYTWYNVTINSVSNTTVSPAAGTKYLLNGSKVTYTAASGWSFGGTTAQDTSQVTVSSAGQSISVSAPAYFYLTISGTNCSANKSSGFYTTAQTITWTASSNYAFDSSGTTTASQTSTAAPNSYSKSCGYGKYTVTANYSTANVSTGWYAVTSSKTTTFTADSNHSFNGSAVSDTTTKSAAVPGSVSATPGYTKCTITGTRCTADKTSGSILANGTTITWTVSSDYSFAEGTTATTTTTATVAAATTSYSKSADYMNITVSGTRCTANIASGYRKIGNTITWTASDATTGDYSFAAGTTRTATTTATIALGTASYSKSADYKYITVSGTNCTANVATGYRAINAQITWTATGDYSFSNSSYTTTSTDTVVVGTKAYSKTASYIWYYITVNANTGSSVTENGSGRYLKDSKHTSTWTISNANLYTFSSTQTTSTTTSTGAGEWTADSTKTISAPTVYTRLFVVTLASTYGAWKSGTTTITSVNCAYNTAISSSSNTLTIGSNSYTFEKNANTDQYTYTFSSISGIPSGGKVIANVTVTGTATRTINTFTITFTRKSQPSSAIQTLGTAVTDTSIGVGSIIVEYGGSYSETFSKTNYVSQTKSGSNVTADATVAVTLVPDIVNITQTDIANASETLNYAWAYKDASYAVTQTVTPNQGYDYTTGGIRYYNGNSYTRSITTPAATSFGSLTMNQFNYTVSGGTATNGTVAWSGGTQIGTNATWTITANSYYTRPSTYTGTKTINSTNFTLNEANKTAIYSGNLGTCTALNYTIQNYNRTGGTVYWSTSSITTSGGSTTLTAAYGTTVYWRIAASTGYNRPSTYYGSMTLNSTNFTLSSAIASGDATYKGSAISNCTRISGTLTQGTLPTGVASITCYRRAWDGSSFSVFTSGTIYYGDQFYWGATKSMGYDYPTVEYDTDGNTYFWTGSQGDSITSVEASGLQAGEKFKVINLAGTYTQWYYYDDDGNEHNINYINEIRAGTVITKESNISISVLGTTYFARAYDRTAQYEYTLGTISTTLPITVANSDVTITCNSTRTTRSYDVTVGFKYNTTTVATQTISVLYGTTISSGSYYPTSSSGYTYTSGNYTYTFKNGTAQSITVTGANQSVYTTYTSASYPISCNITIPTISGVSAGSIWYKWSDYNNWSMSKTATTYTRTKSGYPGSSSIIQWFITGNLNGISTLVYTTSYNSPNSVRTQTIYSSTNLSTTISSTYIKTQTLSDSSSNGYWYSLTPIQIKNTYETLTIKKTASSKSTNSANLSAFTNVIDGHTSTTITSSTSKYNYWIYDSLAGGLVNLYDYCKYYKNCMPHVWDDLNLTYENISNKSITYYNGSSSTTVSSFYGLRIKATPTSVSEEEETYYYGQDWDLYILWHNDSTYNVRVLVRSDVTDYYTQPTREIELYIGVRP